MWKLPCDSLLPEQARRFHPTAAFPWRWWKRLRSRCFQSARREWVLAPVSQMLLFGLLLLTSALAGQRHGTQAESNLSSKFQYSSNKEQNGESFAPFSSFLFLAVCVTLALCVGVWCTPPCEGMIVSPSMQMRAEFIGMDFRRLRAVCNLGSCHKAVTGQRECHCWLS